MWRQAEKHQNLRFFPFLAQLKRGALAHHPEDSAKMLSDLTWLQRPSAPLELNNIF